MSEIEDEIRRRLIAEREMQLRFQQQSVLDRPAIPADTNGEPFASGDTAWPPAPAATEETVAPTPNPVEGPRAPGLLRRWKEKGGILGTIATVLIAFFKFWGIAFAVLGKFKFVVIGFKLLLTAGTMLLSVWAYGKIYGTAFGAGIVALIFIHECGHAIAGLIKGHKPGIMVFVPFMGAFVTVGRGDRNIVESAFIGIMGPVFGTLASLGCVGLYYATGIPVFLPLGAFGFFMNLFNLLPTAPLDGGWITPLFSPKLLAIGSVLLIFVGFLNPLIWVLAILSLPRIISGWKAAPKTMPYYQASATDKWVYGLSYFGLILFLGAGYLAVHHVMVAEHNGLIM